MIEVIYKDENLKNADTTSIKLPKNIRQIGDGSADHQIYIEDNVMNYIKKIPKNPNDIRYGVLLGNIKKGYGYTYIFINGAIDARDIVENTIIFSDEIWTGINDDMHRYFSKLSIIGWFTSMAFQDNEDMSGINRIHLDNFPGQDMIYLKLDRNEDEESVYTYSVNSLKKLPGYHIYFERNSDMDDYIYGRNDKSFSSDKSATKQAEAKGEIVGKYGIEENKRDDKNVKSKTRTVEVLTKIKKNVASVAMVAMLGGTLALVTNENAMRVIKDKITDITSSQKEDSSNDIRNILAVNGMINETTENANKKDESDKNNSDKNNTNKNDTNKSKKNKSKSNKTNENGNDKKIDENKDSKNENKKDGEDKNLETGTVTTIENIDLQQETYVNTEPVTASVTSDETKSYIVSAGDTIYSIAIMNYGDYNKVDEIMKINGIDNPDTLEVGDKIILP